MSTPNIPQSVLVSWGTPLDVINTLAEGVWVVTKDSCNAVLKKRPLTFNPQIECDLFTTLSEHGVPVAQAILTSDATLTHQTEQHRWSLYPHMPGHSVSLVNISAPQAHALGAVLASLHLALSDYSAHCKNRHYLTPLELSATFTQCPRGIIHRDFHPRNVLFNAERVSAVLDFDLVCEGPLTFDLAYVAASLLADAWSEPDVHKRFFAALKEIAHGYHSIRPLLPREVDAIPLLCEEVEELFIRLGQEQANPTMERSATAIKAWFSGHRGEIAEGLSWLLY